MQSNRKPLLSLASATALMLLAVGARAANTWNVPGDFSTIQAAINSSSVMSGDTLLVAAGTYPESLSWTDKDLTIRGAGAGQSVVDPSGGPGGCCLSTNYLSPASRIEGFTFQNGVEFTGGGMDNYHSSPTVVNCAFTGNRGKIAGGGMYNDTASPTVINCTFRNNTATLGGGLYNLSSSPTVVNCTFTGNRVDTHGGGMYNGVSNPTVINCTFRGNSASSNSGGIFSSYSYGSLGNCIFWGDTGEIAVLGDPGEGPTLRYSDVQGGLPTGAIDGGNNINADPLFVDPDNGDLRLLPDSPCINKGFDAAIPPGITTDLDGNPRISDVAVDMGAYEFQIDPITLIQALEGQVSGLVTNGALLPANGQSLYAKLDAAIAALQVGDTTTARTKMQDFINQARALVKTGKLTVTQGQSLTDAANTILALL